MLAGLAERDAGPTASPSDAESFDQADLGPETLDTVHRTDR
jgi:hypothetical protein